MPALAATRDYQQAQVALRALTYKDITRLWVLLDMDKLDDTFPVFAATVLQLIRQRREVSASFARSYLTTLRAGLPDEAPAVDVPPLPTEAILTSLRVSSVVSVKVAMTQGTPLHLASRNALVRTMGTADRFINDGGRELIRASVEADPAAKGWVRRTLGTCDYCAKKAAGEHMHGAQADFPRHDHCGCTPEPVYGPAFDEKQVRTLKEYIKKGNTKWAKQQLKSKISDEARADITEALRQIQADAAEKLAAKAAKAVVTEAETATKAAAQVAVPETAAAGVTESSTSIVDALMPDGSTRFSAKTRKELIKVLEQSDEGKMLLKTVDSFQSGSSSAIPRLRTDIEKYLAGGDLPAGRVKTIENFLSAVNSVDVGGQTLFRGMRIPGLIDDVERMYTVGADMDLSVSSFTSREALADAFTREGFTEGAKIRGKNQVPVFIEWVGGGRGLPIENFAKDIYYKKEAEWVASGRFEVVKVTRSGGGLTIRIRQKATWKTASILT